MKLKKPKVAIIITTYNQDILLEKCIRSLKNKEMVTIIKEILEKRKHFSSNARKFAIQYDWENVSRKISKIYESL